MNFSNIHTALEIFKAGKPIIVVDAVSRENEGDIIFPADTATQDKINFCASKGKGLICIAIDEKTAIRLDLQSIKSNQSDKFHTAFYEPIDASHQNGITTGISALERSITAKLVSDPFSTPSDFIKPGHLFPIVAKKYGLFTREGHTEAGVDLCNITGHYPAAIICEIMNDEGNMMRRAELAQFAASIEIPIISIQQILEYRKQTENHIQLISTAKLPTEFGDFLIHVFRNRITGIEHSVLEKNSHTEHKPIVRIHSECQTGDIFSSLRCDCKDQLEKSMKVIHENGNGLLIYLKGHEGRGIGLSNKIAAYAIQEKGYNTFEANLQLGLPEENRNYLDAVWILKFFKYSQFGLITNNADKLNALKSFTFQPNVVHVHSKINEYNERYLNDKLIIANHTITFEK